MIILKQMPTGRVSSCKSEDGIVVALATPDTTLVGEFELVDASGRHMWRGLYQDADGFYRNNRVASDVWASACQLMDDWSAHQKIREDAAEQAALERDKRRIAQVERLAELGAYSEDA